MEPVSPEEAAIAAAGPHGHWVTFDEALECARYHALHQLVRGATFDAARAEALVKELEDGAQSYGYGTEDSFIVDMAGRDPEEPYTKALQNSHDDPEDSDYFFVAIDESEGLLREAAATPESLEFVSRIGIRVRDAVERGQKMRRGQESESSPSP